MAIGILERGAGVMTGQRYLESLRDGREVWIHGERVKDVTKHPAFAPICQELARIYDMQHEPAWRDTMTFADEDGTRVSYSYKIPKSPEELWARRRNAEIWVRETCGMVGRYPDFCAAVVVGFCDVAGELSKIDPRFGENVLNYHAFAATHDICLSHGLHDPGMDKSLRPEQDPDRCVRVVNERDNGLVVRGARFVTLAAVSNEILVFPSYMLNEREAEFAVWFSIPADTPGVKILSRESYTAGRSTFDHPAAARFDEQDALVVFDDVLVPWERVFLYGAPLEAVRLFRAGAMTWASYSSLIQLLGRLEFMLATSHLLAETAGVEKRPNTVQELGEFATYMEILRGALRAAELDCRKTAGGNYSLSATGHLRAFVPMISERIIEIVEHVGTSALIFEPTAEDMDVPEIRRYIDIYARGKGVSAEDRIKLCKLAWDLTGDAFGGRQQLYERLHAGDPYAIAGRVYQAWDKTAAVESVRRLLNLSMAAPTRDRDGNSPRQ